MKIVSASIRRIVIALSYFVVIGLVSNHVASAATELKSITTTAAGADQVRLRLALSGPISEPSVFTVENPARLSIDLPQTTLALNHRYQRIDEGPVEAVTAAAGTDKTRVVIQLRTMVAYRIQRRGRDLIVTLGNDSPQSPATATASAGSDQARTTRDGTARAIHRIDFRRGQHGAGRITMTLDGTNAPVDIRRRDRTIVAELPGIELPARLEKRLDVTDFATPVRTIDAYSTSDGTRLVITPDETTPFERLAYQTGRELTIELEPLTEPEQRQRQQQSPQYNGQKISLSFQNIEMRSVLQIVADVANVNMVVSDSVSGTIALQLDDVPWDQALAIILDAKSLGMTRNHNVITVAPLAEIADREQAKARARAASRELAPLHSEILQINYAQAADIANVVQSDSTAVTPVDTQARGNRSIAMTNAVPGDEVLAPLDALDSRTSARVRRRDTDQHSLLSPRGHVTVDTRTNSLLITDTRDKIEQIRRLIGRLDRPVRQVLIESRIVVANREFTRNLGVSQTGVDNSRLNDALSDDFNYDANNGGYSVSLPATNATSILSSSIISDTFSLNLELSAMESENNGEIISSPRIITADGQQANIEQGREIPYQSGSEGSDQGTRVEFKKAVLGLNVTPQITPNKKVIMNLNVTQDSVGDYVPTSNGGSVPSIDTRSLTTQVLVNNGDTVVLGGIFEQTNRDGVDGVPFLRKVPLLGALFQGRSRQRDKRELLIFVTPKILDNNLAIGRR